MPFRAEGGGPGSPQDRGRRQSLRNTSESHLETSGRAALAEPPDPPTLCPGPQRHTQRGPGPDTRGRYGIPARSHRERAEKAARVNRRALPADPH